MSSQYCQSILKISLAQICQSLGWNSAQSSPLELLTDVLERYMLQLATVTHRYSEQFGRTDPNLDDVGLAFRHMGININELEEYIRHVEPVPFAHDVVQFPAPKRSNLQFPKPTAKELQTRDEHIPSYMPLMYPSPEDEVDTESDITQDTADNHLSEINTGGQTEVSTDTLAVPGDKRPLTSPQEGGMPKKRPRLINTVLPEEAMHSQYEMKSIILTHSGDLTPKKGGKLPDARTPPQGFKKASHEKPHSPKPPPVQKKENKIDDITSAVSPESVNGEVLKVETLNKDKVQTVEEILIFPDGTSKKMPQNKENKVSVSTDHLQKEAPVPEKLPPLKTSSNLPVKVKKKPGRPRSRSKSPRVGVPKSPAQTKSPGQTSGSPRGRGRPPKDKSLLKTPEKKKEDARKNLPKLNVMEEMFASDVLDLSSASRKKVDVARSESTVVKTEDITSNADAPLDLSKRKEEQPKQHPVPDKIPHRGRGRPPLSPEKRRAREMNIDLCIEAVLKRTKEEVSQKGGSEVSKVQSSVEKQIKEEKLSELEEYSKMLPESNKETEIPAIPSVKKEPEENVPIETEENLPDAKKKKKIKQPKVKDKTNDEVREKLKDKLKSKEGMAENVKTELNEPTESQNVYDFPESPPKEIIKKSPAMSPPPAQSPTKLFSVGFVDKELEAGSHTEGDKHKEKSREKSKEHKKEKKEKKKDKEKKKKNKDKDKEKVKKERERSKEPDYPTVSKLKIRIGNSPSTTTVIKSPTKESPMNSPRPELKLVIKAFPPIGEHGSSSPQSAGGSTPKHSHKERSKKEKKKDKEIKKEKATPTPPPSVDGAPIDISSYLQQRTAVPSPRTNTPTPPPTRDTPPPTKIQMSLHRNTPTPPPKIPTPIHRNTPTPPPKISTPLHRNTPTPPPTTHTPLPRNTPTPPPRTTPPPPQRRSPTPTRPQKSPTPETDFEPETEPELETNIEEDTQRFTPSPASTRKTFTPSPSCSPFRSPSPVVESDLSQQRSKSTSQSPVHTPSHSRSPSPQPSSPTSPQSLFRPSVSPAHTNPPTPGLTARGSPSNSPSPSPVHFPVKEDIPPMPPPSISVGGVSAPKTGVQRTVVAETVTTFIDESGQKIWICPHCKMPDDGSPMIGCDLCDDWYHWPCVGLKEEPTEDTWYCSKCMCRKKPAKRGRGRGRGRGPGRGKKKMM